MPFSILNNSLVPENFSPEVRREADRLFHEQRQRLFERTDHMFALLLALQWIGGIVAALLISPQAWRGGESQTHVHVWLALYLGGAIAILPIYLALRHPGRVYTRHTIAIAQVLFSALLIDVTGGRIETHFHVFVSLAFLSAYKDWTVLIPATVIVALDHLLRGIYLPQSVYGVAVVSPWRWLEHSAWVLFEDVVLIYSCRRSVVELRQLTWNAARLGERTREVESAWQSNQAILDTTLDAVVTIDANDRIVDWNPQAETLFDLPRCDAIGRRFAATMIASGNRELHLQDIARYLQSGQGGLINRRIEVLACSATRGEFPVELSVVPIHHGEQVRFSAFIRDITDRQRTEQALRDAKEAAVSADRAKSDFLAHMSHEIRTPLNGILGFSRLMLQSTDIGIQDRCDYLNTIHSSATNLLTLVNDILDLSKIEAGHLDVERVPCSPGQIIAEVASLLRVRALEKNLRLEAHCAGGAATTIVTDPVRLRQLLMNLAGNAVKFTDQGQIRITGRFVEMAGETRFRVEVVDSGIGIPPNRLDDIFAPFVQVDDTVTRKYGGTGLGLAISRHIAAALGGQINVSSQLGQGTSFQVDIDPGPVQADWVFELLCVESLRERLPAASNQTLKLRGRILLVEDGETNRKLLGLVLRRAGMHVVEAENGAEGVRAALNEPFDLILMDMQMPLVDGYSATRQLRQQGLTLPIVALTAHAMKGDEARCREAGCSAYLAKPIDLDRLLSVVRDSLPGQKSKAGETEPAPTEWMSSTLPADDPEFCAIVAEFRQMLMQQLDCMHRARENSDFKELGRLAHWLKGTGGTVGFTALTRQAGALQQAVDVKSPAEVARAITEIEVLAAQIQAPQLAATP